MKPETKQKLILLRDYSRPGWPMLIFIVIYLTVFTWLEHMTRLHYYVIHSPLDDLIPFCEVFVIPYLSWFGYMVFNVVYIYWFDKETYYKVAKTLYIGMGIFLIVSLLFPNIQYLRPQVMPRDNIFTRLIQGLYKTDTPTNICPSIHVYNTAAVMIGLHSTDHWFARKKAFRIPMNILGILIILSTMFIKQHSVLDVFSAFLLLLAAYVIVYRPELLPFYRKRRALESTQA